MILGNGGLEMGQMSNQPVTLEQNSSKNTLKVYAILLFSVTCYASTFIFGAILVKSFHPVALTFLRLVFINAFLLTVGWRHLRRHRVPFRLLIILAVAGFIGISVSHLSLHAGLKYTDPITAALIYALGPLITSLITYFYLKERKRIYFWIGILLGIVGVAFVVTDGSKLSLSAGKGELLIGVTILTFSIYLVIVEYLSKHLKPMTITLYTSLFALLLLIPFVRVEQLSLAMEVETNHWIILIVTAILTNGFVTILWNGAVKKVGASTSSLFLNMEPFVAMILGYLILQQVVLPIQLIGSVFIITGVIMGTRYGKRKPAIDRYKMTG